MALQAILVARGEVKCFACRTSLKEINDSSRVLEEEFEQLRKKQHQLEAAREDLKQLSGEDQQLAKKEDLARSGEDQRRERGEGRGGEPAP